MRGSVSHALLTFLERARTEYFKNANFPTIIVQEQQLALWSKPCLMTIVFRQKWMIILLSNGNNGSERTILFEQRWFIEQCGVIKGYC